MVGPEFTIVVVGLLLGLIFLGVPIVVALGLCSFAGVAYLLSFDVALSLLANTAYESIRNYIFAVVPLFILMGELVSRCGAARDVYNVVQRALWRVPARLAVATVGGNAVFAAVTGVSIASAAAFTRIAYPQMVRHNYNKSVALGSIAGSSALGMLIPPSVLMIVWGVIAEESIGRLFIAGIIPGILLATMFGLFLIGLALLRPDYFGATTSGVAKPVGAAVVDDHDVSGDGDHDGTLRELLGALGLAALIVLVLGGIWLGAFTPSEAAGMGALFALVLAIAKGMRWHGIVQAVLETGRTSAPILFLLITAQMYSRLLALGGIVANIQDAFVSLGLGPFGVLSLMVVIWFMLGMFIDSVSIILLTVPIFAPIAMAAGLDPIAFAIIGIVAIEAGLLTPPFGLGVYTVKSCVSDADVGLGTIFLGSTPYWIMLLILIVMIAVFPGIATWLATPI